MNAFDDNSMGEVLRAMETFDWRETGPDTLGGLVAGTRTFVDPDQQMLVKFIDEDMRLAVEIYTLGQDEGDPERRLIAGLHEASPERINAMLDICGIIPSGSGWMTWFREHYVWSSENTIPLAPEIRAVQKALGSAHVDGEVVHNVSDTLGGRDAA